MKEIEPVITHWKQRGDLRASSSPLGLRLTYIIVISLSLSRQTLSVLTRTQSEGFIPNDDLILFYLNSLYQISLIPFGVDFELQCI